MRPATFALLALVAACSATDTPVRVTDAWLRALPEGMPSTAAYMTIENRGNTPLEIASVTTPAFARAELHETRIEDGIARMRPVARLEIAPGARVALAPGGLHLMLFDPARAFAVHESVALRLLLADGAAIEVDAEVRAP